MTSLSWSQNPQGAKTTVLCGVITLIGFIFVALRLHLRVVVLKETYVDDYFIIVAQLATIGRFILIELQRNAGLGLHVKDRTELNIGPERVLLVSKKEQIRINQNSPLTQAVTLRHPVLILCMSHLHQTVSSMPVSPPISISDPATSINLPRRLNHCYLHPNRGYRCSSLPTCE
jgi:hypothetical protein